MASRGPPWLPFHGRDSTGACGGNSGAGGDEVGLGGDEHGAGEEEHEDEDDVQGYNENRYGQRPPNILKIKEACKLLGPGSQ